MKRIPAMRHEPADRSQSANSLAAVPDLPGPDLRIETWLPRPPAPGNPGRSRIRHISRPENGRILVNSQFDICDANLALGATFGSPRENGLEKKGSAASKLVPASVAPSAWLAISMPWQSANYAVPSPRSTIAVNCLFMPLNPSNCDVSPASRRLPLLRRIPRSVLVRQLISHATIPINFANRQNRAIRLYGSQGAHNRPSSASFWRECCTPAPLPAMTSVQAVHSGGNRIRGWDRRLRQAHP